MDHRQLFKLRLVVAALGETQRLGWWKRGVLTGTGEFLFQQGFPRSTPFAQSRAGFRVAQLASDEALAIQPTPGGPITCHLFRLTPQLEDAFENERNRWMDEPETWEGTLASSAETDIEEAQKFSGGIMTSLLSAYSAAKMNRKHSLPSRDKQGCHSPDHRLSMFLQ